MLITRIKASNFYGIKDPVEVFFTEGGKKNKIGYANFGKERVSLISGFYGANASGKSTILHVIDTIIRIILAKNQEFVVVNGDKNMVSNNPKMISTMAISTKVNPCVRTFL